MREERADGPGEPIANAARTAGAAADPDSGSRRLRVLVVTRNYPPLRGGMERLVQRFTQELARDFDLAICGPSGCESHAPAGALAVGIRTRPLAWFLVRAAAEAWALARRWKPDLVFAGSGVAAPIARLAARGKPVVVYLHGLDVVTRHPLYRALWLPAIRRCNHYMVNSRFTAARALEAGCSADRIQVLNPATDFPLAESLGPAAKSFRDRFSLAGVPMLLSVGRLTARKGLAEFIDHALPAIVAAVPAVRLVVIGDEASEALGAGSESQRARIMDAAARQGLSQHVTLLGHLDDEMLSGAYAAGDALVFPALDLPGDAEGFGMVALEAAAHGTPTLAFAVGGVPDAVRDGESGWLLETGDYSGLAARAIALLSGARPHPTAEQCRAFASAHSWEEFGASARSLCREYARAGQASRAPDWNASR